MHERSLAREALRRVQAAASEAGARRVLSVRVALGALCGASPAHLRRHFAEAARGTIAEGARLEVVTGEDPALPGADGLRIEAIEIEE